MKSSRTAVAVITGIAALTLAACGPAGVRSSGPATPTTSAVISSVATDSTSPTPSTSPTTLAPTTTAASVPVTTKAKPAVRHSTAPPVHHTSAPPVHRTTAPPKSSVCSIRSNAGNCYKAGQFCRKADLGRSTTDANGRAITCKTVSGKPHWHY